MFERTLTISVVTVGAATAALGLITVLSAQTTLLAQTSPSGQASLTAPSPPTSGAGRSRLFPPGSLGLLEAPDRAQWQKPDLIMDALKIAEGDVVAELGAAGGWFTARLARRVGPNGLVYAEDIQSIMLEATRQRLQREGLTNVRTVLGTSTDPKLPPGLDAVLIADAYREMDDPARPEVIHLLLKNAAAALKADGRLGIVDYTAGGGGPGPAADERVEPEKVIAAAESAGLTLRAREQVPPFQFLLVFGRVATPPARRTF
jgi:SAM-dependent methyltransferase